jgi:response regulator RpfG family c-di-GMP phosphodiesterase
VKIFLITAFEIDEIEFRRVLPSVGVDEFLEKPISAENFIFRVKKHVNHKTMNELDKEIIAKLDIPSALKDLLISHSLNVEKVLNMKSSDIAETLGIDQDAARLIFAVVRR